MNQQEIPTPVVNTTHLGYENIQISPFKTKLPQFFGFLAFLMVIFLFSSSVLGRRLERFFNLYITFIPLIGLGLLIWIGKVFSGLKLENPDRPKENVNPRLIMIFIILLTAVFIYLGESRVSFTIERIHLVKYSLLGFLCFFAQDSKSASRRAITGFLIAATIGCLEEGGQHFLKDRFFDPRDIELNVLSCLYGSIMGFSTIQLLRYRYFQTK